MWCDDEDAATDYLLYTGNDTHLILSRAESLLSCQSSCWYTWSNIILSNCSFRIRFTRHNKHISHSVSQQHQHHHPSIFIIASPTSHHSCRRERVFISNTTHYTNTCVDLMAHGVDVVLWGVSRWSMGKYFFYIYLKFLVC